LANIKFLAPNVGVIPGLLSAAECDTYIAFSEAQRYEEATSFQEDGCASKPLDLRVQPTKGMGLIFHHPIPHRGDAVTAGRKYVLRTDVMFGRWLPPA
jgi:hypothetical protein